MAGNRIARKVVTEVYGETLVKSGVTIRPGDLVTLDSNLEAVLSVAASVGPKRVALENALYGESLTDNYTGGDNLKYIIPRSGDVVQLRIASSVSKGDVLRRKAAGEVDDGGSEEVIGIALEAGSSADGLIDVEIA